MIILSSELSGTLLYRFIRANAVCDAVAAFKAMFCCVWGTDSGLGYIGRFKGIVGRFRHVFVAWSRRVLGVG